MRRVSRYALLAGCLLGQAGCQVPHEYARAEFSAPLPGQAGAGSSEEAGDLDVIVRFAAGSATIGAATEGLLYRAVVAHCATHTSPPEVVYEASPSPSSERLSVTIQGRAGGVSFGGERNGLTLDLPASRVITLDLSVGEGESMVDLSGLAVAGLRIAGGSGDARLVFGTPNEADLGEVFVESLLGDVSVDRLGNANARRVVVRGGVGSIELDLTGDWRRDAAVIVEASIGDVEVVLPDQGRISLAVGPPWSEGLRIAGYTVRDGVYYSEDYESPGPRVDMTIEAGIGSLSIEAIARQEARGATARPPASASGEVTR